MTERPISAVLRRSHNNPMEASREKNADGALLLLALATAMGDRPRATLARSILRECGKPGGEGAPPVDEAVAAIPEGS